MNDNEACVKQRMAKVVAHGGEHSCVVIFAVGEVDGMIDVTEPIDVTEADRYLNVVWHA